MPVVKVDCTWFNYWLSACSGGAAQYGQTQTKSSAGKDPCCMAYDERLMRGHLEQCYDSEKLSHFPRTSRRSCKRRIYKEVEVEVYCICRFPDVHVTERFGHMAECDSCKQWYHQECLDIPDSFQQ